jgi:hypothetical protein
MIIEDFALVLRRRLPWEALDLGVVIARQWRRPALAAWLATYGVAGLVCSLLVFWDWRFAWFLIWWSKPLFERVLLFVYSRAVFGSVPTLSETLSAALGFLGSAQLWADLTFRRFSPTRSFNLPVTVLEAQAGKSRATRIRILGRTMDGCATWLTIACANFVALLNITVLVGIAMLNPNPSGWTDWLGTLQAGGHWDWLDALAVIGLMMLCETMVEPLYVASGFSLYLNRRSELEGWDLELSFRRMQRRLDEDRARGRALAAVLAAVSIGLLAWPEGAPLAAPAEPTTPHVQAEPTRVPLEKGLPDQLDLAPARAKEVLSDPAFGHDRLEWHWQSRYTPQPASDKNSGWLAGLGRLAARLAETLALLSGWLVRVVLVLALVLAIIWGVRWNQGRLKRPTHDAPPETLFGFDMRKEALPADIGAAARLLMERGAVTDALGLLYRACLVALVHRVRIPFLDGDTEERCLMRVTGRVSPASLDYFRGVVDAWRSAAYAHRAPASEQIVQLCTAWEHHFGQGSDLEGVLR